MTAAPSKTKFAAGIALLSFALAAGTVPATAQAQQGFVPPPAPTPEQTASICKRIQKGLENGHRGLALLFKGVDTHPGYNPQYMVNSVAASCGEEFVQTVAKTPKPVFKTPEETLENRKAACISFQSIVMRKDEKGNLDPDSSGMYGVITKDDYTNMSFNYACGESAPPPANMPVPPVAKLK